jgi:mRNA interferase MazF
VSKILRGEIWLTDLNPVRGREQAGTRPCLIISVDMFNQSPAQLVLILPITSKNKRIASHVKVLPPEGGLTQESFIKCEDVRSISVERLERRYGSVSDETMAAVEQRLRILMGL